MMTHRSLHLRSSWFECTACYRRRLAIRNRIRTYTRESQSCSYRRRLAHSLTSARVPPSPAAQPLSGSVLWCTAQNTVLNIRLGHRNGAAAASATVHPRHPWRWRCCRRCPQAPPQVTLDCPCWCSCSNPPTSLLDRLEHEPVDPYVIRAVVTSIRIARVKVLPMHWTVCSGSIVSDPRGSCTM